MGRTGLLSLDCIIVPIVDRTIVLQESAMMYRGDHSESSVIRSSTPDARMSHKLVLNVRRIVSAKGTGLKQSIAC